VLTAVARSATAQQTATVGAGVSITERPYAGADPRIVPVPMAALDSPFLFLEGTTAGLHLFHRPWLKIDAVVQARLDGFESDDLGTSELATNDVDRAVLEDRDGGADAGLAISFRCPACLLRLSGVADVSRASEGSEVRLAYQLP